MPVPVYPYLTPAYEYRSKGLTEEGLAKLGYDDFVVLRPGFLRNRGGDFRMGEHIAGYITHAMSFFTPNMEVEVRNNLQRATACSASILKLSIAELSISLQTTDVGRSILWAATKGSSGLPAAAAVFKAGGKGDVPEYTVIPNKVWTGFFWEKVP